MRFFKKQVTCLSIVASGNADAIIALSQQEQNGLPKWSPSRREISVGGVPITVSLSMRYGAPVNSALDVFLAR